MQLNRDMVDHFLFEISQIKDCELIILYFLTNRHIIEVIEAWERFWLMDQIFLDFWML